MSNKEIQICETEIDRDGRDRANCEVDDSSIKVNHIFHIQPGSQKLCRYHWSNNVALARHMHLHAIIPSPLEINIDIKNDGQGYSSSMWLMNLESYIYLGKWDYDCNTKTIWMNYVGLILKEVQCIPKHQGEGQSSVTLAPCSTGNRDNNIWSMTNISQRQKQI